MTASNPLVLMLMHIRTAPLGLQNKPVRRSSGKPEAIQKRASGKLLPRFADCACPCFQRSWFESARSYRLLAGLRRAGSSSISSSAVAQYARREWNSYPSRPLVLPSFEDAVHCAARLKPFPDTNPSGFHFLLCFHLLKCHDRIV